VSSCLFLWLFSLAQYKGISPRPTGGELLNSFVLFSFMLLGGGGCYHFLAELISIPLNSQNLHLWRNISTKMSVMMLILLSTPISLLFFRDNLSAGIAWLAALFYLPTSFGFCFWIATKIKPIFIEMRSNIAVQRDSKGRATAE
jgi:hypothetical protein